MVLTFTIEKAYEPLPPLQVKNIVYIKKLTTDVHQLKSQLAVSAKFRFAAWPC